MAFYRALAEAHADTEYDDLIWALAGSDPAIYAAVKGIISKESSWNPRAYNPEAGKVRPAVDGYPDGSYGLMQLLMSTARGMAAGVTPADLLDPGTNITLGVRFFMWQLRRYNGSIEDAVAAYHAGTARRNASGLFTNSKGETFVQTYVNDVLTYAVWYQDHLPSRFTLQATSPQPPYEPPAQEYGSPFPTYSEAPTFDEGIEENPVGTELLVVVGLAAVGILLMGKR